MIAHAQNEKDSLLIDFKFKWKNEPLEVKKIYHTKTDSLEITTLKFYVSGIEIHYDDTTTYIKKNSYHLVDIEDVSSLKIAVCPKSSKAISNVIFSIGVDSLASVSGAMSGDLDPTNGMYWAWQSGYINMKIEGKSNSCTTRKNAFQFHIGGYLPPNSAIRKVNLYDTRSARIKDKKINNNHKITIQVDASKLFDEILLKETNSIMISGKEAMNLADLSVKIFTTE